MKQKLKNSGSLVNHIMGNNSSVPKVGEGATILHYTDRTVAEVIEVSEDGRKVLLEAYNSIRTDNNGMSDCQQYRYELSGRRFTLVYRNGAWRNEITQLLFTDKALDMPYDKLRDLCTDEYSGELNLVEGLTYPKKSYPKVSVIFGVKNAYHDYSF